MSQSETPSRADETALLDEIERRTVFVKGQHAKREWSSGIECLVENRDRLLALARAGVAAKALAEAVDRIVRQWSNEDNQERNDMSDELFARMREGDDALSAFYAATSAPTGEAAAALETYPSGGGPPPLKGQPWVPEDDQSERAMQAPPVANYVARMERDLALVRRDLAKVANALWWCAAVDDKVELHAIAVRHGAGP